MVDTACESTDAVGNSEPPARSFTPTKKQMALLNGRLIAAKFGDMVTILMQSKHHQDLRLADLRNRIVPPLLNKQYRVTEAGKGDTGVSVPAALILWARVSDSVHERLKAGINAPFDLTSDEWQSGENYWIIDIVGEQRCLAQGLTDLRKTDFKDKIIHYRVHGKEGAELKTLHDQ